MNIIYLLLLINFSLNIIILPFYRLISLDNLSHNDTAKNIFFNSNIQSKIILGTPKQELNLFLTFEFYSMYISGSQTNINATKFIQEDSNTFKLIEEDNYYFNGERFKSGFFSKDNFYFKNYNNKETKIENFNFCLSDINKFSESGQIGLNLEKYYANNLTNYNLIKQLKLKNIINKEIFTVNFTNFKEGNLIIGELPEIYDKKHYESDDKIILRAETSFFDILFQIIINTVIFNNEIVDEDIYTDFKIESNYITVDYNFGLNIYNNFFKDLIENKKLCHIDVISDNDNLFKYNYIYCNEDSLKFIKNFPKINFILKSYNFNFEFSGIELFQKINEFYYFQIIYPVEDKGSKKISLGAQFFIKYQMSFNIDAKTIIFYKKTVNKSNKNNLLIILIIILIIFIIFSIGLIYYLNNFRNRRKRKNELNEYIEYEKFIGNKLGV